MQNAPLPALTDPFLEDFDIILWNSETGQFAYATKDNLYAYLVARLVADGHISGA